MAIRDWFKFKKREEERLPISDPRSGFWYSDIDGFRGGVTASSAAHVAAIYACTTAIKESVAMLPVTLMRQEGDTKTIDKSRRLYRLLHDQPNRYQDSFGFFETMQQAALDSGNAYAFIERSKTDEILSISYIPWEKVEIVAPTSPGAPIGYTVNTLDGKKQYTQRDIFHFKPHSKDGITGRTPIRTASDTVAFAQRLLEYGNALFENGAFHSGFIESPTAFKNNETREQFMNSFLKYFGSKNAGMVGLLESGVKFKESSMNNRDAQFLESKEFSVIEIARLYRIPPALIQAMDKGMAFASIEQLNIMFAQYTIQPWITRWERAIKQQLLGGWESIAQPTNEDLIVKFNVNALLRGDMASRTSAIVSQLQYGLLTINEARELEDRNPISEEMGDKPMISHNLRPVDSPAPTSPAPANTVQNDAVRAFEPLLRSSISRFVRRSVKAGAPTRAEDMKDTIKDILDTYYSLSHGSEEAPEYTERALQGFVSASSAINQGGVEQRTEDYLKVILEEIRK
jgi:HK97 family phage portal protein